MLPKKCNLSTIILLVTIVFMNPTVPEPPQTPAFFLASHLALDFLNSRATPDGNPVEWIGDGKAFANWYRHAGLATTPDARALLQRLRPKELDKLATDARELRESVRAGVQAKHRARMGSQLRAMLNQCMEGGSSFFRLELADDEVKLRSHDRCTDAAQLLVPLAVAAARLFAEEDLTRVRHCEGLACSLWFLDRTKSGTRRFCSAATCGNRAKVAAFRARERESKNDE